MIAIALLALALRALAIARGHQLDIDEADTALKVAKPIAALVSDLTRDGHPPLYFLLLKGWTTLFGHGEAALRGLSLVFSGATLVLLMLTARRVFGAMAAVFAGLFFAFSPVEIFHASEGRMYTLVPLLALAAFALAHEGLREPPAARDALPARTLALLAAVLVAGLYTHNYGLFIPAAVACAAAVAWAVDARARRSAWTRPSRRIVAMLAVVAAAYAAYAPWVPVLESQRASMAHVWLIDFFDATPPILAVPLSLVALAGIGPYPPITPPLAGAHSLAPLMLPLGAVLFAAGIAELAASRGNRDGAARARFAPVLFLGVLLGAPWLVSVTIKVIYLVGRYDVIALPFVLLILGAGAARLARWRRALIIVPLVFLLAPLPGTRALLELPEGGDVVGQVRWIAAHPETRAVITTQLSGSRFRYYLAREGRSDAVVRSFPTSTDEHPGWFERPDPSNPAIAADADALVAGLRADLAPGELLWATLYDNDAAKPILVQTLARYFAPDPDATRLEMGLIAVTPEAPKNSQP
ncbi:MAG: glycosyltransferase family 39 protein [bacterium]